MKQQQVIQQQNQQNQQQLLEDIVQQLFFFQLPVIQDINPINKRIFFFNYSLIKTLILLARE